MTLDKVLKRLAATNLKNSRLIQCMNAKGMLHITKGKKYQTIGHRKTVTRIVNDLGQEVLYFSNRFRKPT